MLASIMYNYYILFIYSICQVQESLISYHPLTRTYVTAQATTLI